MEWQLMTAEQKDITGLVRKFLENELAPLVQECDGVSRFPMEALKKFTLEVFKKMGEIGLWGMDIPAEYGGPGFDLQTLSLLREEFGRVDCGFAVSFGAATVGFKQVLAGGSEEQKRAMAERLLNGEISAMCITEPQSGSDVAGTKTKAVRVGDEYIINGTKTFITNGGLANVYVVVASTNPELGHKGLSCFIVERNTPGVSVGKEENKMGIRLSNTTDVIFQDVRIPATNLIGEENKGFAISQKLLARTRPTGMASALGVAQRALDLAVDYAQQRVTFGKPIASRQAIKFKLADMEIRLQTARAQLFYNAQLIDKGIYDGMLGSVTKTCVSEMVFDVANQALQIFGGYGYSREYPVEKLLRDARIFSLFEGTNEIQRMIIGGTLVPKKRN